MTQNTSSLPSDVSVQAGKGDAGRWIWITLFGAITLVVLVGAYAYYRHEIERIRQEKYEDIAAIAKLKAGHIQEWRTGLLRDVLALSTGPLFKRGVGEWLRNRSNEALRADLRQSLLMGQKQGNYADALLLDRDGNVLLSVSDSPDPLTVEEGKAIRETIASGAPRLSYIFRSPQGSILLSAVAPMTDAKGAVVTVGMYRTNLESELFPLIQTWPAPSKTAETLLVRKEDDSLLFLNNLRHRPDTALTLREPLTKKDLHAVQAVLGKRGMFLGKDYRGHGVLADLSHIPDSPWFMVSKVDTSEILEEARYRGGAIVVFCGLFILLVGSATAFAYRHRQAGLYKRMYRAERQERLKQEEFRTTLYSIGDAVITTDTAGIVKQMNPVAEHLTGWTEKEVVGRPLEEVFCIINEHTRQPCENPVQKVLQTGQMVGLANHTLLISRDGTERLLADSGAPIRTEDGSVLGVVLVFRDVTDQAKAEEALKESEVRYGTLFENMSDAVAVYRAENDGEDFVFVAFNAAGERIEKTRKENVIGRNLLNVFPGVKEFGLFDVFQRVWRTGLPERHPVAFYKDESIQGWRENCVYKLPSGDVVAIYTDETERKRSEAALSTARKRLESVFLAAPVGLGMVQNRVIKEANDFLCRMTGYTKEELNDSDARLLYPTDEEYELVGKEKYEQIARYGIGTVETVWQRKDGGLIKVLLSSAPIDRKNMSSGVTFTALDITDRKRSEKELSAREREYRTLVQNLSSYVVRYDTDLRRIYVNPAWEKASGLSAEEVIGVPLTEIPNVPSPANLEYLEKLRQVIETGARQELDFEWVNARGDTLSLSYVIVPEYDQDGKMVSLLAVGHDVTERKQAEAKLRESEEQYRRIVETANEGIWAMDGEFRTTFVNQRMAEMLGYTIDDMLGKPVDSFMFDEDLADHNEKMVARRRGQNQSYERRFRRKDGSALWAIASATALKDPDGNFRGSFAMFTDFTDRKQAEENLQRSEERYRTVADFNYDWEYWVDADGKFLYMSPSCERITGYTVKEFLDDPELMERILHPDDRHEVLNHFQMSRKSDYDCSHKLDFRIIRRDGHISWIGHACQPVYGREGKPLGRRASNRDITERKQAEEALRQSESRYRAVVDNLQVGISVINRKMEVVAVNPFFQAYYPDVRPGTGQICYAVYNDPPESAPCSYCPCVLTFQDGQVHESQTETAFGGTIRNYRLISCPVKDELGEVQLVIELVEDITERRSLYAQLAQAQKMEAVGTLAGGVAHDFNNILQVALGYSELLLSDDELSTRCRSDLFKINEAAKRGAELVQRLLTFSRKTEVKPQPLNLNRRIEDLRKMIQRTIPKMISIELSLERNIHAINADPTQIDQVLMNLVVNARDAMPDGGTLTVETSSVALDEEYARGHLEAHPGQYVLLTVSDTGSGMDKETLEHIFEPFYTTKGKGEGTGLGLAMVHGIVKQHGGHIRCYSEPGRGTAFKLYFPALMADEELEQATVGEMPRGGSETVLLVDDEELIRDLGSRILTKAGYNVIAASNGKEALEVYRLRSEEIDLVVLDLIMPEMGGKKCLDALLTFDPSVRVVIASGYSADALSREALISAAKGFVDKPYNMRQMLGVVRGVLDAK